MPSDIFPYANIIVGILIFVIGFIIHWLGQLISLINWDLAVKIGVAEKNILPEFKVYELGIAAADVLLGWIYGIAAVGLILDIPLAYKGLGTKSPYIYQYVNQCDGKCYCDLV